jgi:hypothetical protein
MGRFIELQRGDEAPSAIGVRVGDVLSVGATGGHVHVGSDVVRMLGAFLPAVVSMRGDVVQPMGPPSLVLFLAVAPGTARIDVTTGDPWSGSQTTAIALTVDP